MPTGIRLTHEEFIERVAKNNPNIEVIGTYVRSKDHIKCRCKIHNCDWEPLACDVSTGKGTCPQCLSEQQSKKFRKSNEQFLDELYQINPNIEPLEEYRGRHAKIKCRCKVCGHEWDVVPGSILNGHQCPACANRMVKPLEQITAELEAISPNIEIIGGMYENSKSKLRCRCRVDGYEWTSNSTRLLRGDGCPRCSKNERKTTSRFIEEMSAINPSVAILGEYINANTKILCRCENGHDFEMRPMNLISGEGCPHCRETKGERKIRAYLTLNNISFIPQHYFEGCNAERKLWFDFYLPNFNICIEYDGEQHFRPVTFGGKSDTKADARFQMTQLRDEIKTRYCEENNITLIRIPYTDFDKIENILDKQLL